MGARSVSESRTADILIDIVSEEGECEQEERWSDVRESGHETHSKAGVASSCNYPHAR